MSSWDSSIVDYHSDEFARGLADGRSGKVETPPAAPKQSVEYASYMEGWLMGDAEKDIDNARSQGT